jgi:hypothetical protein
VEIERSDNQLWWWQYKLQDHRIRPLNARAGLSENIRGQYRYPYTQRVAGLYVRPSSVEKRYGEVRYDCKMAPLFYRCVYASDGVTRLYFH